MEKDDGDQKFDNIMSQLSKQIQTLSNEKDPIERRSKLHIGKCVS